MSDRKNFNTLNKFIDTGVLTGGLVQNSISLMAGENQINRA